MSLLDKIEVEEVKDDDVDPRPKRGDGLDIDFNKSYNNEDIVLSCVARIPKKYYENYRLFSTFDYDTWEIYKPIPKFVKQHDINNVLTKRYKLCLFNKNIEEYILSCSLSENTLFDNVFKGSESENLPPLFCNMQKILSIESLDVKIEKSVWHLIDDILAEGDLHSTMFALYWDIMQKPFIIAKRDINTWLSFLKSFIPVRLVDEDMMPKLEVPVEFPYKNTQEIEAEKDDELLVKVHKIDGDFRYMEALGIYNVTESKREILLCPKRIKETADKLNVPFNYLIAIVYIHELGHAALDETIDLDEEANKDEKIKIKFNNNVEKIDTNKDNFSFVMEESLANMIMLQYINWYTECCNNKLNDGNVLSETAELLVKKQSPAYAFGLYQFDADVNWLSWRYNKANISDKQKSEWYDLFGNIMNPNIYRQSFNKLFN